MGKGDIKSRRGKRKAGSAGVSRQKKKKTIVIPEKPKAKVKKSTSEKKTTTKKPAAKKTAIKKTAKKA